MFDEIANADLTSDDVPGPKATWWEINQFALTFDGYSHWGSFDACAELANAAAQDFAERGLLPDSLTELRACLFFEQRRWRHFDEHPDEKAMRYLRGIVAAIREKVLADSRD